MDADMLDDRTRLHLLVRRVQDAADGSELNAALDATEDYARQHGINVHIPAHGPALLWDWSMGRIVIQGEVTP